MSGIWIVAKKEFLDSVTSKKFILVLSLLLIIFAVAINEGIERYNESLEYYKEEMMVTEEMPDGPPLRYPGFEPSILDIFLALSYIFGRIGPILSIALGFDLISGEKERGSLKSLLSHPVYRDEVINGKAIGGISAIVVAMLIVTSLSIGFLMISGIVPDSDELLRILIFMGVSLLLMLSYFSVSLMSSTVAKNSTRAILYAIIVFFVLSSLVPLAGFFVSQQIVGDRPEHPAATMVFQVEDFNESSEGALNKPPEIDIEAEERYQREIQEYYEEMQSIQDVFSALDPSSSYQKVSHSLIEPENDQSYGFYGGYMYEEGLIEEEITITESLQKSWSSIVTLVIFPIAMFAIAYIRFMRMDLR
ncbi:MAG: ABC transporter permease [Halobacteriota archaeon]|nr:ABC transporter permease [Halobacteriota archaeon]